VPSRPYFHGREDFYLQDGALIAYAEPFTNRHGLRCHGLVKVLTRDRRYGLHSLDELIRACQEVYGAHPRYDIDPPEEP
jgi:hypothetical protein